MRSGISWHAALTIQGTSGIFPLSCESREHLSTKRGAPIGGVLRESITQPPLHSQCRCYRSSCTLDTPSSDIAIFYHSEGRGLWVRHCWSRTGAPGVTLMRPNHSYVCSGMKAKGGHALHLSIFAPAAAPKSSLKRVCRMLSLMRSCGQEARTANRPSRRQLAARELPLNGFRYISGQCFCDRGRRIHAALARVLATRICQGVWGSRGTVNWNRYRKAPPALCASPATRSKRIFALDSAISQTWMGRGTALHRVTR